MSDRAGIATPEAVIAAIQGNAYRFTSERDLQDGIGIALFKMYPSREHVLGPTDRPDFFIDGIAIEVKPEGSLSALTRQVHRYAGYDEVRAVVVVTSRHRLAQLPPEMNGKPVSVVIVERA